MPDERRAIDEQGDETALDPLTPEEQAELTRLREAAGGEFSDEPRSPTAERDERTILVCGYCGRWEKYREHFDFEVTDDPDECLCPRKHLRIVTVRPADTPRPEERERIRLLEGLLATPPDGQGRGWEQRVRRALKGGPDG